LATARDEQTCVNDEDNNVNKSNNPSLNDSITGALQQMFEHYLQEEQQQQQQQHKQKKS